MGELMKPGMDFTAPRHYILDGAKTLVAAPYTRASCPVPTNRVDDGPPPQSAGSMPKAPSLFLRPKQPRLTRDLVSNRPERAKTRSLDARFMPDLAYQESAAITLKLCLSIGYSQTSPQLGSFTIFPRLRRQTTE